MAFVSREALKVTYSIQDQERSSQCSFYIGEAGGNLPNIHDPDFRNFIGEFGDNLSAVSDGYVSAITFSFSLYNDANLVFGPAPDVERKGVLQFKTEDGFQTLFTIPGAKYSMFAADGENIIRNPADPSSFTGNPLAAPLQSIHDKLRNGVTIDLVTYPATDRRAKDIRQLVDAYKQHRSNPRG